MIIEPLINERKMKVLTDVNDFQKYYGYEYPSGQQQLDEAIEQYNLQVDKSSKT